MSQQANGSGLVQSACRAWARAVARGNDPLARRAIWLNQHKIYADVCFGAWFEPHLMHLFFNILR
jgi:hypothetical protein